MALETAAVVRAEPATAPLHLIDFFDAEFLQDPYPAYARLRQEAPVYRDPRSGIVFVSTYDLVMEVNRQPAVFSNAFSEALRAGSPIGMDPEELAILAKGVQPTDTMLTADPPAHTRYRKLGMKAFTYKRVEQMGEYVTRTANALIDRFAARGECEFKSEFGNMLPMTVIADALGVPRQDINRFFRWSEAFIIQLSGVADREQRLDAARRIVEFQTYFIETIEEKRANPTEDIVSDLVHADLAEEGDPRKMDYSELISIIQQLLVAGNETTSHTLTAGLYYLLTHPEQLAAVRADPSLVPGLVEETLRFLSPTNNMWRLVKADAQIGGFSVKAGEILLVRYGSANRDSAHFANPDQFDITRENAKSHLAFGAGIHTCIGAQLARKEMNTAFPILLERLRDVRLKPGAELRYSPNVLLRGVLELPIAFDPA